MGPRGREKNIFHFVTRLCGRVPCFVLVFQGFQRRGRPVGDVDLPMLPSRGDGDDHVLDAARVPRAGPALLEGRRERAVGRLLVNRHGGAGAGQRVARLRESD